MELQFIKRPGGVLEPADDLTAEKLTKFKTGEQYQAEVKRHRNPAFHRKMFAFFNFAFEFWRNGCEFQDESAQFDKFRNDLTVQAGYYHQVFSLDGQSFELVPMSLSFGSMDQDEFEKCAIAMQNAAMRTIFKEANDQVIQRLYSFF